MAFTRIWCVYEMSESLAQRQKGVAAGSEGTAYTYDVATAIDHVDKASAKLMSGFQHHVDAVVITDGLTASFHNASDKMLSEDAFPLTVLDKGSRFECAKGEASVEADRVCSQRPYELWTHIPQAISGSAIYNRT